MHIKYSSLILFFVFALVSCETNTGMAKRFNDQLNASVKEVQIPLLKIDREIAQSMASGDKEKVKAACEEARALIEKSREKIKAITPPEIERAKDLQQGCLNLLSWDKMIYEDYAKLANATTEKAFNAANDTLQTCLTNATNAQEMLKSLHEDFATKNGASVREY